MKGGDCSNMHPVQNAFANHHATQCGYCTPGFVMNTYTLLLNHPNPMEKQIEEQFDGNLRRCTGYCRSFDAVREFSSEAKLSDAEISDGRRRQRMCRIVSLSRRP